MFKENPLTKEFNAHVLDARSQDMENDARLSELLQARFPQPYGAEPSMLLR